MIEMNSHEDLIGTWSFRIHSGTNPKLLQDPKCNWTKLNLDNLPAQINLI